MNRPGTFGFSSTFIFATVARPSYSAAMAAPVGARRRHGPHHSAQKSTRVTPFLISVSKLLSVNVLTFSDAMSLSLPGGPRGAVLHRRPSCGCRRLTRPRARVYFDVLPGRSVPGKILGHPAKLNPFPDGTIAVD